MPKYSLLLIFFLTLMLSRINAQEIWSTEKIDSTIKKEILILRKEGKLVDAFNLGKIVLKKSQQINYLNGTQKAYYVLSSIMLVKGRHKESMLYLDTLISLSDKIEDTYLAGMVAVDYARSYHDLGYLNQALEKLKGANQLADEVWQDDTLKPAFLEYLWACESWIYEEMGEHKLRLITLHKSFLAKQSPIIASRLAKYYTTAEIKYDSALFYIQLGEQLYKTGKYPLHDLSILLRNKGRYYAAIKNYKQAIECFKQSVEISESANKMVDAKDTYKLMYPVYEEIGDDANAKIYLQKYTQVNDSIQAEKRTLIEIPHKAFTQDLVKTNQQEKRVVLILSFIGILVICIVWYIIYKREGAKRKQKEQQVYNLQDKIEDSMKILSEKDKQTALLEKVVQEADDKLIKKEQETRLLGQQIEETNKKLEEKEMITSQLQQRILETDQILSEQEEISSLLQKQVNDAFDELIVLAKENQPNFYTRFQEVYPLFQTRLLYKCQDLQVSELTLCAYIYLDFSSKEIAEYTFKSVRTVQNRKYSIRKKLGISTDEDIHAWMKNVLNS